MISGMVSRDVTTPKRMAILAAALWQAGLQSKRYYLANVAKTKLGIDSRHIVNELQRYRI
jgi:hypothetical protein